MRSTTSALIILFTNENCGTVVRPDNSYTSFGEYRDCWTSCEHTGVWKPFEDELILVND